MAGNYGSLDGMDRGSAGSEADGAKTGVEIYTPRLSVITCYSRINEAC